jgi:hypothetical protein
MSYKKKEHGFPYLTAKPFDSPDEIPSSLKERLCRISTTVYRASEDEELKFNSVHLLFNSRISGFCIMCSL